ncbi:MAG TPA: hypothetical protein VLW54_07925, partial [Candidatus Acidoferrales bacterium]|nr:hypothetical protein [Candidatus Acidoferrales bacterium]
PVALVSNSPVGRFRFLRKGLFALPLGVCLLLCLALLAGQVEQRVFRHRAERLLSEVQSMELRKTPWNQAQNQLQHWGSSRSTNEPCNEHECSLTITLDEFVYRHVAQRNLFIKLDDYLRRRLKLSYDTGPFVRLELALLRAYMWAGGHPAKVFATIGMRDGVVWSKGLWVIIETPTHKFPGSFGEEWAEYALIAEVHSVPRFDLSGCCQINPQLALHHDYEIGQPGGCELCVLGWARFTPYAAAADVHRLLELDLSCLTRWHPCLSQSDIMRSGWDQYLAERPRVESSWDHLACSPAILEILGRDSADIAAGEVLDYQAGVDGQGNSNGVARVRALQRLKGAADWRVGETREIPVFWATDQANPNIRAGTKLIFFGDWARQEEFHIDPREICSESPANEANLDSVRRGIEQDYTAKDKEQ